MQNTITKLPKYSFVADASLRNLQIIIEALIDVGGHIVACQNLGGLPKTYADVIKLMVQAGIIPEGGNEKNFSIG